jgi:hypothetical protein
MDEQSVAKKTLSYALLASLRSAIFSKFEVANLSVTFIKGSLIDWTKRRALQLSSELNS